MPQLPLPWPFLSQTLTHSSPGWPSLSCPAVLPAHTAGFPAGLTASRHIPLLQKGFPTSLTVLEHTPSISTVPLPRHSTPCAQLTHTQEGPAFAGKGGAKLRRSQPLLDILRGVVLCPRARSSPVCGHRHPRKDTPGSPPAQLWMESEQSPCLCAPSQAAGQERGSNCKRKMHPGKEGVWDGGKMFVTP